jgi:hypothetical protein
MRIPFYINPDGTHCWQASLKMVIEAFYSQKVYNYQELEVISAKPEDGWTWPLASIKWMFKNGFDMRIIGLFDLEEFAKKPEKYLYDYYVPEVAEAQIAGSDIASEVKHAKALYNSPQIMNKVIQKIPSLIDLNHLLKKGFLIIVNVNAEALYGNTGYVGHFVVVKEIDEKFVYINDSALDDGENRKVTHRTFKSAWYYKTEKTGNCYAFKRIKEN